MVITLNKPHKKRLPVYFLFFLGILITTSLIFMFYGWNQIDKALVDYETHLPVSCVKEYYQQLSDGNFAQAAALGGFTENEFTTEEELQKYFESIYQNGFDNLEYIKRSEDENQGTIEYYIYSDSKKVGRTLIRKTGEKSEFGFDIYKVEESDPIQYYKDMKIIVPENAEVFINGVLLSEEYRGEDVSEDFDFSDTGYNGFKQPLSEVYVLSQKLLAKPEIVVRSQEGNSCPLLSEQDGAYTYYLPELHRETLERLAKQAATEYSKAIEHGTAMDGFFAYAVPGTSLYKKLKNYHSSWIIKQPEYSSETIDNFIVSNYREYSDSFAVLDISLDYTIYTYNNTQKNVLKASYKMYFIKANNEWKILDMDVS